jgi:hypothetical protein
MSHAARAWPWACRIRHRLEVDANSVLPAHHLAQRSRKARLFKGFSAFMRMVRRDQPVRTRQAADTLVKMRS